MNDHREPPPDGVKPGSHNEMAGMDEGMRVLSYLIAGVLVYGALGWVGDHFLGTSFLLPIGIVLGAAGGCYVIIRRYGQVPAVTGKARAPGSSQPGSSTIEHRAAQNHEKTEGA